MHLNRRVWPNILGAILLFGGCLVWLNAGRVGVADDASAAAEAVAREWRHPDSAANRYRMTLDRGRVVGDMFLVAKPFKDVWEFYAKKCGHTHAFPEIIRVMSTGSKNYMILLEGRPEGGAADLTSSMTFQSTQNIVQVTLAPRSDGVLVQLSVVTR